MSAGKKPRSSPPPPARGAEAVLRTFALGLPDSVEEFPWGHRVMKVRGKIFVIFGGDESALRIAVKLPRSGKDALARPNCEPTPYGMGKHGWVTSSWPPFNEPDVELLKPWIEESYHAIVEQLTKKRSKPDVKKAKAAPAKAAPAKAAKAAPSRSAKPARGPSTFSQRKIKSTKTRR